MNKSDSIRRKLFEPEPDPNWIRVLHIFSEFSEKLPNILQRQKSLSWEQFRLLFENKKFLEITDNSLNSALYLFVGFQKGFEISPQVLRVNREFEKFFYLTVWKFSFGTQGILSIISRFTYEYRCKNALSCFTFTFKHYNKQTSTQIPFTTIPFHKLKKFQRMSHYIPQHFIHKRSKAKKNLKWITAFLFHFRFFCFFFVRF